MSKRGPPSKSEENKESILQLLDEKWQGLTFTELHNHLKEHIGSKSTLSELLKDLMSKGEIEKDGKGKYCILDSSLYNAREYITWGITKYVDEYSKDGIEPYRMLEALLESIGYLSLYCAIQEIKMRRKWTEISSKYVSRDTYLLAYLKRHIVYEGLKLKGEKINLDIIPVVRELIGSVETNFMEDSEFKTKIIELEYLLNELCPRKLREFIEQIELDQEQKELMHPPAQVEE